ncbi:MAG TPA: chromate efflux transporter [Cyclobacteriaceae bacterium]|nr:chromate efflux transporter [Cyclobacteriaceae bacterium]
MIRTVRYIIFLRDVALLSVTCFGGPQAHLAHFQNVLVKKRGYLDDDSLNELNALAQVLPGPTSTQTLSAVGFRLGGPNLAYLTLLIWMLPSVAIMTAAGIIVSSLEAKDVSFDFTRFIQPMAVGMVAYAAYSMGLKTVKTKTGIALMIVAAVATYLVKNPFVFPITLLAAGSITAFKYRSHPKDENKPKNIRWENFFLWIGVLVIVGALGLITKALGYGEVLLPIRLFENFYRNGSLVFGGGQVLTPMLYTEFVTYAPKQFLNTQEFLMGYALVQALPGPLFSFSAFIGALAMRDFGPGGEIAGAVASALGMFLPGTFLIFFLIRVWDSLKKYRPIRASLEGINAANTGLIAAGAILLFQPLENTMLNFGMTIATFALLAFTKFPSWAIIIIGLALGFVIK